MPKIPEYTQQTDAQGGIPGRQANPDDFGGTGLQRLGMAVIDAGGELGRASRALKEQAVRVEVTNAHTNHAQVMAQATLDLEERARTAQPGDETFSEKFNEGLKTQLDNLDEKFSTGRGQAAWAAAKAEIASHFVLASGRKQAHLAGVKATQDFTTMVDSYQVLVNTDPTRFGEVKGRLEQAMEDPDGAFARILPEDRAQIKRVSLAQLANATMEGLVRSTPEIGKQLLNDPTSATAQSVGVAYLTGEQLIALKSKAEVGIERNHTLKEREHLAQKRAKQDAEESLVAGFTKRILDPKNQGGMPSDVEIAGSGLSGEKMAEVDRFKVARLRELAANGEDKKHPAEVHRLLNQMIADEADPKKTYNLDAVRESYRKGRISTAEETFLEERFARLKDGSTNTFERDLNGMMGSATHVIANAVQFVGQPDAALEAIGRIRDDAYTKAERLRKENKDPRAMLDPKSKDYFFSRENLSTYVIPPSQALKKGAEQVKAAEAGQAPAVGTMRKGYRFKGGDPKKEGNWEKIPETLTGRVKPEQAQ